MIELTDQELLSGLSRFEDNFLERKTTGDKKDWLKTVVAFANSAPIDSPAVLYIGVKNDGTIESSGNLDTLQKTFRRIVQDAYPPIYYQTRVLETGGKQFLAVIVPGSASRPHFAGPSYIRVGSETKVASERQFNELLAQRQSKAYEILKWKGQPVSYQASNSVAFALGRQGACIVEDCHQHYVTLKGPLGTESYPLSKIEPSWDDRNNRLSLEINR